MSDTEGAKQVTMVVITGHSGAGKSEAIAAFEDGGYFCVDNLPPRMIGSLGELFRHEGSGVRARRRGLRRARRRVLRRPAARPRRPRRRRSGAQGAVPGGRRADPGRPLQGDPPPPSAGARRPGRGRDPRRARAAGAAARARRRRDGHQRTQRRGAAPPDRRGDAGRGGATSGWRSPCSPSASRTGRRARPT